MESIHTSSRREVTTAAREGTRYELQGGNMLERIFRDFPLAALLTGTGWLALAAAPVQAQGQHWTHSQGQCPPPPCGTPTYQYRPMTPPTTTPGMPGTPTTPQAQTPTQPTPMVPQAPALGGELASAVGGEDVAIAAGNVGYIDSAIIRNQFRLRFDSARDNNRPDRAEFFYPKCGCFGTPDAKGPPRPETMVDYQEVMAYLEWAPSQQFSAFVEVPYRFLNPEANDNTNGIGDVQVGVRWGLFSCQDMAMTLQLKVFLPTGDGFDGLGTEHYSVEPGFLAYVRLTDRLSVEAEVRDWISIDGSDFAGNVLRYGIGAGYDVYQDCNLTITPVAEFVAWSVLSGQVFDRDAGQVFDASGDTIVNGKLGVRATFGSSSIYAGYGRALTGDVWYKEVVRLEYRVSF
jgi:hypothetical protein